MSSKQATPAGKLVIFAETKLLNIAEYLAANSSLPLFSSVALPLLDFGH